MEIPQTVCACLDQTDQDVLVIPLICVTRYSTSFEILSTDTYIVMCNGSVFHIHLALRCNVYDYDMLTQPIHVPERFVLRA